MTSRLAILAQFDPDHGLPPHVRLHLEALRPLVDRLVLASNSPLAPAAAETAEALCDRVIVRPNTGWDFAAWRDALAGEDAASFDRVILTNSSIIGPLFPLGPILEDMEARCPDVWGMVMSRQKGLHLQSYFLSASARVVGSTAWRSFWSAVRDIDDKDEVIRRYEIGFSQAMLRAGFELTPMFGLLPFPRSLRMVRVERLGGRVRIPFSINWLGRTVRYHEELLRQGMPYLKASLLFGKDVHRFVGIDRIMDIPDIDYPFDAIISATSP